MKKILFILFIALPIFAQQFPANDPYINSTVVVNSVSFTVDRFYPFFGSSEKPFSSELGIRITDQEGKYTAYLYFRNQFISPTFDPKRNILRLYFSESHYQLLLKRLEDATATSVNYRQYKDGHSWGDVDFDKYPR